TAGVKGTLYLLWGGAFLVLLIGGLNIANLALARLTLRRKETPRMPQSYFVRNAENQAVAMRPGMRYRI
ncbi:MAG: hypothetical protein DMG52_00780, partial [Acidobacteria bacterium]